MIDASSYQNELATTKDQVSTEQKKLYTAPEDIRALISELQEIQGTFREASRMSNIGSQNFCDAMDKILRTLNNVARDIGNIKL